MQEQAYPTDSAIRISAVETRSCHRRREPRDNAANSVDELTHAPIGRRQLRPAARFGEEACRPLLTHPPFTKSFVRIDEAIAYAEARSGRWERLDWREPRAIQTRLGAGTGMTRRPWHWLTRQSKLTPCPDLSGYGQILPPR